MNLLITGVSGYVGQAVVRRLIRDNPFDRIFGVDLRPPRILGPVRYVPLDMRADELAELLVLDDIQVVLHLAYASGRFEQAQEEVFVAQRLLEGARLGELRRVVLASPDRVYRAGDRVSRANQPLCGMRGLPPALAHDLRLDLEEGGPEVVVLRTGNIIGPERGGTLDPFLSLAALPSPTKRDPLVQLLHIDDAAEIFLAAALHPDANGAYDVAGTEPIPLSVVAGILQKRLVRLSGPLLDLGIRALTRTRLLPMGPTTVRALHHGVPLDTERLAELGYTPRYTTRQTLAVWRTGHTGAEQALFRRVECPHGRGGLVR